MHSLRDILRYKEIPVVGVTRFCRRTVTCSVSLCDDALHFPCMVSLVLAGSHTGAARTELVEQAVRTARSLVVSSYVEETSGQEFAR